MGEGAAEEARPACCHCTRGFQGGPGGRRQVCYGEHMLTLVWSLALKLAALADTSLKTHLECEFLTPAKVCRPVFVERLSVVVFQLRNKLEHRAR